MRTLWQSLLCLAMLLLGSACMRMGSERDQPDLYRTLGERAGVEAIVKAIFVRVYADPRIVGLFANTDRVDLERLVVEQICMEAGGPVPYTGRTMTESHAGLNLTTRDFDAFVEDFILGMEDAGVPYRTQNRLLKIFAPMRGEIIHK